MSNISLSQEARTIRDRVIEVSVRNGAGHIAPSLSCIEILTALYYRVLRFDATDPQWPKRDRFILSKSHGCYGLYAILADLGMLPTSLWENFYTEQSDLTGCSERRPEFGIEAGCGSLGHGLPLAVGLAFGAAITRQSYHTYCLMGDGETQEGTTWEALQFAVKHNLNNLTLIIDDNRLQAMDFVTNILDTTPDDLQRRLQGFGLTVHRCDGHNAEELASLLENLRQRRQQGPAVLLARTVKGYGLKCMENVPKFHFRLPTEKELEQGRTDA